MLYVTNRLIAHAARRKVVSLDNRSSAAQETTLAPQLVQQRLCRGAALGLTNIRCGKLDYSAVLCDAPTDEVQVACNSAQIFENAPCDERSYDALRKSRTSFWTIVPTKSRARTSPHLR